MGWEARADRRRVRACWRKEWVAPGMSDLPQMLSPPQPASLSSDMSDIGPRRPVGNFP